MIVVPVLAAFGDCLKQRLLRILFSLWLLALIFRLRICPIEVPDQSILQTERFVVAESPLKDGRKNCCQTSN